MVLEAMHLESSLLDSVIFRQVGLSIYLVIEVHVEYSCAWSPSVRPSVLLSDRVCACVSYRELGYLLPDGRVSFTRHAIRHVFLNESIAES